MPRIPYPQFEQLDDEARKCMQGVPRINALRMLSHSGPVLAGYTAFCSRILHSLQIEPVIRELTIVRVGQLCDSAYELAQHERFIADLGVSPAKIAALQLGADQSALLDIERAVVAFVDDIVTNVRASDKSLAGLRPYFSARQVVELIMLAGCYQMLCMMLETCGVEIEAPGEVEQPSQQEWRRRMQIKRNSSGD